MKKVALALCAVLLAGICTSALATTSTNLLEPTSIGLPALPLMQAIVDHERVFMSGGTCAKIRPVALHSDCTFFLCEQYGCGAPFHFDPVDCACYCGYAF